MLRRTMILGAVLVAGSISAAQEKPSAAVPPAAAPAPEPKAVLDRMSSHYSGVQGATVKMSIAISAANMPENAQQLEAAVRRPNRLKMTGTEGDGFTLVCDGTNAWQSIGAPFNFYTKDEAPADLGGLVELFSMGAPSEAMSMIMNPGTLIPALFDPALFKETFAGQGTWSYVRAEEANGVACDRIHCTGGLEVDFWIATGPEAWMVRIEPDYAKQLKEMGIEMEAPKVRIDLKEWAAKAEFPPEQFAFTPPKGAKEVDSMQDGFAAQMGKSDAEEGGSDLLGKAAPELTLELLEGGKMSLAGHKDKGIVLLDFWATWCPPCVRGLPLVSEVAAAFKDKGVVFYAINEHENAETIRPFLEDKGLQIKVALDKDGAAGTAFGVTGIPQTVLIGKDGTVQVVHVGLSPNLKQELTEQIESLLAGKNLTPPPTPAAPPVEEPKGKP